MGVEPATMERTEESIEKDELLRWTGSVLILSFVLPNHLNAMSS